MSWFKGRGVLCFCFLLLVLCAIGEGIVIHKLDSEREKDLAGNAATFHALYGMYLESVADFEALSAELGEEVKCLE